VLQQEHLDPRGVRLEEIKSILSDAIAAHHSIGSTTVGRPRSTRRGATRSI
jgi:hypothetical protein